MAKYLLLFVFLIFMEWSGLSQIPDGYPFITTTDLPEAKISGLRVFTGTSLFGYIDGGAELYLEYGFSGATVAEVSFMGATYKAEVYKMSGPEEAFGIFSVSKYRCLSMPPLAVFTCQTKYQLQFCKGPYYISVISRNGTRSDSSAMLKIGQIIEEKINEPNTDLSGYFPGTPGEAFRTNCFLAKGRLGIVNGSPDLEDFFTGVTGFTAVIINEGVNLRLSINFNKNESLLEFLKLHQWENVKLLGSDQKLATGEVLRLISDNHLLVTFQK
jgi:hypothetical protein